MTYFITRLKDNTNYGVLEVRANPADPILRDEVILLPSEKKVRHSDEVAPYRNLAGR